MATATQRAPCQRCLQAWMAGAGQGKAGGKLLIETHVGRAFLCSKVRGGRGRQNISLRSSSKRGDGCTGRALEQGHGFWVVNHRAL